MSHVATHIELRPNLDGQSRAFIEGTRVRVQDVAVMSELQGYTPDQIVTALPSLTLGQVHAALSYYFDHIDELRQAMREDAEFVAQCRSMIVRAPINSPSGTTTSLPGDALPS